MIKQGKGIDAYQAFVQDHFDEQVPYIAFSPKEAPGRIISQQEAEGVKLADSVYTGEINYSDRAVLENLQLVHVNNKYYLQVLVRIGSFPNNFTSCFHLGNRSPTASRDTQDEGRYGGQHAREGTGHNNHALH